MSVEGPKKNNAPQINAKTFGEKMGRGLGEFAAKEISAPFIALILAYGGSTYISTKISNWGGSEATVVSIADTKDKISEIRKQQNKKGIVPEWWDRVVVGGNITSSVNALEAKLKALEAKKNAFDGLESLVEIITLFGLFIGLLGYTREYIGQILDRQNRNWRENKIVSEANNGFLEFHNRLLALENQAQKKSEPLDAMTTISEDELKQLQNDLRNMLSEFREIQNNLNEIDK